MSDSHESFKIFLLIYKTTSDQYLLSLFHWYTIINLVKDIFKYGQGLAFNKKFLNIRFLAKL